MSCSEYITDMGEKRNAHSFYGKTEGKKPFGNLGIDGRIILKWILNIHSKSMCRPDSFSSV
jgi:hypothetical protein